MIIDYKPSRKLLHVSTTDSQVPIQRFIIKIKCRTAIIAEVGVLMLILTLLASDDIRWKFEVIVEKNNRSRVKCTFSEKVMSGGITRLKEHFEHKKGQVASCDRVSSEVRVLMMQHLQESNAKQFDKRKRKKELKEQIRATQCDEEDEYGAFNMHSDNSDPEMAMARQESLRFQSEYEKRERFKYQTGDRCDVGGSSGAVGGRVELGPPPDFDRRYSSLRETGTSRTVRTTSKGTDLSSPAARLAEIEVDLHRSKGNEQAKLLSRLLKAARKKLGRTVSQFVIYTRLPINTVNSPWLEPMLDVVREVGKGTKLPHRRPAHTIRSSSKHSGGPKKSSQENSSESARRPSRSSGNLHLL